MQARQAHHSARNLLKLDAAMQVRMEGIYGVDDNVRGVVRSPKQSNETGTIPAALGHLVKSVGHLALLLDEVCPTTAIQDAITCALGSHHKA